MLLRGRPYSIGLRDSLSYRSYDRTVLNCNPTSGKLSTPGDTQNHTQLGINVRANIPRQLRQRHIYTGRSAAAADSKAAAEAAAAAAVPGKENDEDGWLGRLYTATGNTIKRSSLLLQRHQGVPPFVLPRTTPVSSERL